MSPTATSFSIPGKSPEKHTKDLTTCSCKNAENATDSNADDVIFSPSFGDESNFRSSETVPFGLLLENTNGLVVTKSKGSDIISSIKVLTKAEVPEVLEATTNPFNPNQAVVVLMNQEYMTGVDMYCKTEPAKDTGFTALRIHTNQRTIDVFDDYAAIPTTYRPPKGYYISGFMGNTKKSILNKLAFKCLPVTSSRHKLENKTRLCPYIRKFGGTDNASSSNEESSVVGKVKAVGLTYSADGKYFITNIRVLSPDDLEQLKQAETKLKCRIKGETEILFVLVDDEYIQRVDIVENRNGQTCKELKRVRFYTNRRQSPWYGNSEPDSSNVGYKTFQVTETAYICGFYKTTEGFGCYNHITPIV